MEEWDVLKDPKSDLSSAQVWEPIFAKLESGYYDVLILSPPCGTYSRARHRSLGKGGPVPLRSFTYPWGFPWLSNANRLKVDLANFFVKQCLRAISLQIQSSKFWLLEHPEDLGRTKSGEVPGSIWQLPELHELVLQGGATWAIHQRMFEAATSKPTRLASNLPAFLPMQCSWPQFDPERNYLGPLGTCPHGSHPPLVACAGEVSAQPSAEERARSLLAFPYPFLRHCLWLGFSLEKMRAKPHRQIMEVPFMLEHFYGEVCLACAPLATLTPSPFSASPDFCGKGSPIRSSHLLASSSMC